MKEVFITLSFFIIPFFSECQSRTITGKVVAEYDLTTMPEVMIRTQDTVRLGSTDKDGVFEIEFPVGSNELLLTFIGMEGTYIKVPADCNHVEVIMMDDVIYDYISIQSANRKRYRRFKDLANKHGQANEKGIFSSAFPCFTYVFRK